MTSTRISFFALALLALAAPAFAQPEKAPEKPTAIPIADVKRSGAVDFQKDILPLFKKSCTACHNATDAKGDLVLETPQTIAKGGESGAVVVPGKGAESLLLHVASHQVKPTMPPKNNKVNAQPLKPEELGLIKLWIDQGAKGDVIVKEVPLNWQPLPPGLNPVYSVAITDDGQYVAAGRANQIFIYHVPTKSLVTRLTDPALIKSGFFKQPGNAHRDLVQSLQFSPDSTLLASGGYRIVKLWRKPANVKLNDLALGQAVSEIAVSADGKRLGALGPNHTVKLFELPSGKPGAELKGHTAAISDVKFSADGSWVLTASADKTARLWNTADGKQLAQLDTPSEVHAVAWLAKEAKFATGHEDKLIRVWNTAQVMAYKPEAPGAKPAEKPAEPAKEEKKEGDKKDEKKDDKKKDDKPAAPPEPAALKPVLEIKLHTGPVTALATVPTADTQLLSGSQDGTVRHINADNGQQVRNMAHGSPVTAVAVRPDGQRFASAGGPSAKLWRADNGTPVAELKGEPAMNLDTDAATRMASLQGTHVEYYKKLVTETEARKKAETDAMKKANDDMKKADDDLKVKGDAFKKVEEAKKAADAEFAKSEAALKAATDARAAADAAATQAKVDAKTAQDKLAATPAPKVAAPVTPKPDPTPAGTDMAKLQAEKTKAEAYNTERQTKLKQSQDALTAAKAELAKKPGDAAIQAAVKAAETSLAGREAKAKEAADALAKAVAALAAAKPKDPVKEPVKEPVKDPAKDPAVEAMAKAHDAAKKAFDAAEEKRKAADAAKVDADKKLADATNAKTKADQAVKAQDKPFTDAKNAMEAAQRVKESAGNAVASAGAALQRAEEALSKGKNDQTESENAQKQAVASVEAAKKAAADSAKPIGAVAFSADNRLIATGGEGQIAQTWSAEDGSALASQRGHGGAVLAVAFTAQNDLLSGSADQHLITWDLDADWKLERTIGTGDIDSPLIDRVLSLAFSPDGKTLATGGGQPSRSGEVKLWNVETGSQVSEIKDAHSDTVFGIQFSYDGKKLATCAADKFVKTWTVADGKFIASYEGHTHHVLGVSWAADGRTLMSAGADNVVKVWDAVAGGQKRTVQGFGKEVTAIRFIGVSDTTVASCGDASVKMIKDNGQNVRSFTGTSDFMHCVTVTPDGKFVAAGGQTSVVHVWNGTSGVVIGTFDVPKEK